MKTAYTIGATALMSAMGLSSCLFEEDDAFSVSASQRIADFNADVRSVLTSPVDGWRMQYFPNTASRGYNIMASFTADGVCKTACIFAQHNTYSGVTTDAASTSFTLVADNPSAYREASSLYQIDESSGSVLAMVSYNDILSAFVAPQLDGTGYAGDDHFIVLQATPDEVLLKGERYGGRIRMVPAGSDWRSELTTIYNIRRMLFSSSINSFYLQAADSICYMTQSSTGIFAVGSLLVDRYNLNDPQCQNALTSSQRVDVADNGAAYIASASVSYSPFVVTPDGLWLQSPCAMAGVSGQEFCFSSEPACLETADGSMRIIPTFDRYLVMRRDVWYFDASTLSGTVMSAFRQLTSVLSAHSVRNARIGLGYSNSGNSAWGLVVEGSINGRTTSFCMSLDATVPGFSQGGFALSADASGNLSGDSNFLSAVVPASGSYHYMLDAMRQLASALTSTFDVSVDSYFSPSQATYQSLDASFTIRK